MSSTPAPRTSSGTSLVTKILAGCGCGCLVLLVLFAGACVLFYKGVVKPAAELTQSVVLTQEEAQAAQERLAALDVAHPSRVTEPVGEAVLTADDLDRYLRARAALQPSLAAFAQRLDEWVQAMVPPSVAQGAEPSAREVLGVLRGSLGGISDLMAAQREVAAAATTALEAEQLGPTEFARMAEILEWRFLQRPDCLALGLPEWKRSDLAQLRLQSALASRAAPTGASGPLPAGVGERLAALEQEARADLALSDATRALLEARRDELAALPSAGLALAGDLGRLEGLIGHVGMSGSNRPGGPSWDWRWSTTSRETGAASDPAEAAPVPDPAQQDPAAPAEEPAER